MAATPTSPMQETARQCLLKRSDLNVPDDGRPVRGLDDGSVVVCGHKGPGHLRCSGAESCAQCGATLSPPQLLAPEPIQEGTMQPVHHGPDLPWMPAGSVSCGPAARESCFGSQSPGSGGPGGRRLLAGSQLHRLSSGPRPALEASTRLGWAAVSTVLRGPICLRSVMDAMAL